MKQPSSNTKDGSKLNTKNCSTKSQINTLPNGWSRGKIHAKITIKRQIISETSLFPKGEYAELDEITLSPQINDENETTSS